MTEPVSGPASAAGRGSGSATGSGSGSGSAAGSAAGSGSGSGSADDHSGPVLRVLTRTVVRSIRSHPRPAIGLVCWSAFEAVPTVLFGQAVARAVDAFRAGDTGAAIAWLCALAVSALVGGLGARRVYDSLAGIVEPFRDDLVRWVVRGCVHRSLRGRPDLGGVARLTHQVEIARDTLAGVLTVIRGFLFGVAGSLLGLLTLAPVVLLLVVPPLLISLFLFGAVVATTASRQRELIVGEERIAEECAAMAEGLRDITACGGEERMGAAIGEHVETQAAAALAVARMAAARAATVAIGGWLPALLVLAAAPWLIRHGATAGTVVGALTYVTRSLHPALSSLVVGIGSSGLRLAVTMIRIMETGAPRLPRDLAGRSGETDEGARASEDASATLETVDTNCRITGEKGAREGSGRREARKWREDAAVESRGLTFTYGPHAHPVIEDLDLFVPHGDHLAIVGPSGIGKSTLAALVAGLLAPVSGELRVNGLPPGDPEQRVFLPQDSYVFDGTLRENLVYLLPGRGAREAEVRGAVDAIGLRRLIRRLGGMDVPIDPSDLSDAERQQIALARAYLAPMPLVVLDEATCHLDADAEAQAETAFARRPGTLILIAHRMSSALRARRILVLDGTSARIGRHETLLEVSELYRDLVGHWRSQPAALFRDADGLHPVLRPDLGVDPGEVVAHRPDRQH